MTKKEKKRNDGQWTEARYKSFIISALRQGSQRWPAKHAALKAARRGRGLYECAACGAVGPPKLPPEKGKTRKRNNAVVDHIEPVVPLTGWVNWDSFIEGLYCEKENLQVLCYICNKDKCERERTLRREGSPAGHRNKPTSRLRMEDIRHKPNKSNKRL